MTSLKIDTAPEAVVNTSTGERTLSEVADIIATDFGTLQVEAAKARPEDSTTVHLLISPKEKL